MANRFLAAAVAALLLAGCSGGGTAGAYADTFGPESYYDVSAAPSNANC